MARDDPQVNIRMPAHLKARMEECARESGRSLTAEIIHRLEESLKDAPERDAELRMARIEAFQAAIDNKVEFLLKQIDAKQE